MSDSILGKNKNLRLAVAHAIDLEKMRQLFTQGTAIKASSIYPPSIAGHKENKLPFFYNLEKAKKFLNEAGYPDGKGLPVFQFDVRGSDTNSRQMAEFIEQQLEKVGIKIQVNLNQFSKFIEKANKGQLQLWLDGWTLDYPDAENILHLLLTRNHPPGQNSTSYSNPKVDELFNEYNLSQNENEKLIILSQIELLVMDDLPWILQYYSVYHVLTHGNIKNYRPSDLINNGLRYIIKE